jgi:hypothetical protein
MGGGLSAETVPLYVYCAHSRTVATARSYAPDHFTDEKRRTKILSPMEPRMPLIARVLHYNGHAPGYIVFSCSLVGTEPFGVGSFFFDCIVFFL